MRAGAEGQARIQLDDNGAAVGDAFVMRADPQAPAETHGMEVAQPFAFPYAVSDGLVLQGCGVELQCLGQLPRNQSGRDIAAEQRLQPRGGPQPHLADRRLQHCIIAQIAEGYRQRAEFKAGLFRPLCVQNSQRKTHREKSHQRDLFQSESTLQIMNVPGKPNAPGFPGAGRCWS